MDLDPTFVIPAILFTVVAIYFASSFLNKKPDASAAAARNKTPKVGYGDDVPPSRALGQPRRPEPEVSPRTEPPAPAEKIQVVPVKVEPEPVKEPEPVPESEPVPEPVPELVQVPETVPEPVSAQEVAAVSEAVPESELGPEPVPVPEDVPVPVEVPAAVEVLEPVEVPEPVEVLEPVEVPEPVEILEPVEVPEAVYEYDPEPVVESEPVPEVVPVEEESLPELIPGLTEEVLLTPELLIETDREPEPENVLNNDEAAAEDQVKFTPGKKQSKFETLMTKEEMEEEQRAPEQ